jgi:hypothetical protein
MKKKDRISEREYQGRQTLDLQNHFHFHAREVARKTLNIASLRDMKVTVPFAQ